MAAIDPTAQPAPTLPVAERFVSINGEGLRNGCFSTFVRFVGCNLACSYCDTQWACDAACPHEDLKPRQILRYVQEQGTPFVTLTGGEPALQPALPALIEELVRNTTCFVEVETNGAAPLARLHEVRQALAAEGFAGRVGFTMDWKLPSSGMADRMHDANLALLGEGDCVKFVAGSTTDLEAAMGTILEHRLFERCPVLFSPVAGALDGAQMVSFLQANDLLQARVQLQLHKILWPGESRGV